MPRPFFNIMVVFWGRVHRGYFLNLLLASLLAPGNIPAISHKARSQFLICTTEADWEAIQEAPLFVVLKTYIEPVWIPFDAPQAGEPKLLAMSRGHALLTTRAFENQAVGVFVTPDMVLPEHSLTFIEQVLKAGKKAILYPALRYEYEGCLQGFKALGMQAHQPLALSNRRLMSVTLKHLHSESKQYLWDSHHYASNPVSSLWALPNKMGYVMHTVGWAALAADYAYLEEHDISTFQHATFDHDYIYRNFSDRLEDYYVVHDSDELMPISLSREEEVDVPPAVQGQQLWFLGALIKKNSLRNLYHSQFQHHIDPLRRQLVHQAVLLHHDALAANSETVIRRARSLVTQSIQHPPRIDLPICEQMRWGERVAEELLRLQFLFKKHASSPFQVPHNAPVKQLTYGNWRRVFKDALRRLKGFKKKMVFWFRTFVFSGLGFLIFLSHRVMRW